jgi:hypothetical protein
MKIDNNQLILGRRNCTNCSQGSVPTRVDCDKCNGTGNGIRGGKRGCRQCTGVGYKFDHDNRETCDTCNGDYENFKPETPYDFMKLNKDDIAIKVVRDYVDRQMTFAEQYIGMGLFSCTDYGRHKTQDDDELIESAFHFENGPHSTQGIKLIRNKDDLRICDYISIVVGDQGYSVIPVFEEE